MILRDLQTLGVDVHVMVRSAERNASILAAGAVAVDNTIDALVDADLDGIVVCTPAATHASVLDELESVTVPIFVEKPMTVDAASAERIAARTSGRLFVMDKWRYHPGIRALRDLRASGVLGDDVALLTTRVQSGTIHEDVNCVWTLLPHDLSIALEIHGRYPEPVGARAEFDDGLLVGLESELVFDDGVPMRSVVGIAAPAHVRTVRVVGSERVATLGGGWDEQVVITSAADPDGEPVEVVDAVGELPLLAELRMFVEHLRGGPAPVTSALDAAANVAIVERLLAIAGRTAPST